jgi:hypothetical protein
MRHFWSKIMKPMYKFKGYSILKDDSCETVTFLSNRLSGSFGDFDEQELFQKSKSPAEAQKKSELQSLLLMASLMLGDRAAAV